jgi:hypothetical protein
MYVSNEEAVKLLLDAGVDPDIKNNRGKRYVYGALLHECIL